MFDKLLYRLGRLAIQVYTRLMLKMDVSWHMTLPDGPKIIAANHPSTTDPFLVMAMLSERVSVLVLDTLFKVPLFGPYLRQTGHVSVTPGNGRTAFEQAQRLLDAGQTVVIFPEGDISPSHGRFHRPRTGAARLALLTGAPVIPIGIHLRHERIRRVRTQVDGVPEVGTWYLRGPYAMTVGQAMYFDGDIKDRPHVRSISEHIMQQIVHLARGSAYRMQGA